jgi:hypothetical protein
MRFEETQWLKEWKVDDIGQNPFQSDLYRIVSISANLQNVVTFTDVKTWIIVQYAAFRDFMLQIACCLYIFQILKFILYLNFKAFVYALWKSLNTIYMVHLLQRRKYWHNIEHAVVLKQVETPLHVIYIYILCNSERIAKRYHLYRRQT